MGREFKLSGQNTEEKFKEIEILLNRVRQPIQNIVNNGNSFLSSYSDFVAKDGVIFKGIFFKCKVTKFIFSCSIKDENTPIILTCFIKQNDIVSTVDFNIKSPQEIVTLNNILDDGAIINVVCKSDFDNIYDIYCGLLITGV